MVVKHASLNSVVVRLRGSPAFFAFFVGPDLWIHRPSYQTTSASGGLRIDANFIGRRFHRRPCLAVLALALASLTLFVAVLGPAIGLDVPALVAVVTLHIALLPFVVRGEGFIYGALISIIPLVLIDDKLPEYVRREISRAEARACNDRRVVVR